MIKKKVFSCLLIKLIRLNFLSYKALAKLIKQLNFDELDRIGKHAREVYFNKYSKKLFINKLINYLNELKH